MQVDSANKRGSLLEVVQVLNDLNLIIRRAYISSDGGWFMDGDAVYFISRFISSRISSNYLILNAIFLLSIRIYAQFFMLPTNLAIRYTMRTSRNKFNRYTCLYM